MKKNRLWLNIMIGVISLVFIVMFFLTKNLVIFKDLGTYLNTDSFLSRVLNLACKLFISFAVICLSNIVSKAKLKKNTVDTLTVKMLICNILKYIAIIVAIMSVLAALGVDTTTLITASGVVTLVFGLGCQKLVSDVVSGFFLLAERDIQLGDVASINGFRGTVIQIGLRRIKLEDDLGNINIISNSSINNVINYSKELSYAITEIGIEYDESIEKVEKIINDNLENIKNKIPDIIEGPFYKGVQELADSAVVIKVIAKCKETNRFQVQRDLNKEMKLLFDENHINIPFKQVVVTNKK